MNLDQLRSSAAALNESSNIMGNVVNDVDTALKSLHLGVVAAVDVPESGIELGYARLEDRWGLYIRELGGGQSWYFNDAPRHYRVVAIDKLEDLMAALARSADQTTDYVQAATAKLMTILKKLREA